MCVIEELAWLYRPAYIHLQNRLLAVHQRYLTQYRTLTETNTHPYDTKTGALGWSVRACVARKSKTKQALPIGGGGGAGGNNKEDRQVRLAGAPCWVSVWCGHSAGQPEEGYRLCWHGGPHCALTGELLGWKEIAIG